MQMTATPPAIIERLGAVGIIAVLVIDEIEDAVPVAKTLLQEGICGMELTLRTEAALGALDAIIQHVPEMFAGVGTILTTQQVMDVKTAGASFGVAPGYNREVVAMAAKVGLPFAPGVATPSEIEGALSQGCTVQKFFHAEGLGGLEYLKGINSPYKHLGLKYIPLGGVGPDNLREYLKAEEILAVGGSWIAPQALIKSKNFAAIAKNAREAVAILKEIRG